MQPNPDIPPGHRLLNHRANIRSGHRVLARARRVADAILEAGDLVAVAKESSQPVRLRSAPKPIPGRICASPVRPIAGGEELHKIISNRIGTAKLSGPLVAYRKRAKSLGPHARECIAKQIVASPAGPGDANNSARKETLPGWAGSMGLTLLLRCWWGRAALCSCLFPLMFAGLLPLLSTSLSRSPLRGNVVCLSSHD